MEKKLLTVAILILLTFPVFSQNMVSSFMNEVGEDVKKNVMMINVSGKMLRLATKYDESIDKETRKMLQNVDKISVVIGLSANKGLKQQLDKQLKPYEELMSVVEDNQSIRMYTKETKGQIDEFVLIVLSSDNVDIMMSITGKIDLNQIAGLSTGMKIQGVEHLDKLNNRTMKNTLK